MLKRRHGRLLLARVQHGARLCVVAVRHDALAVQVVVGKMRTRVGAGHVSADARAAAAVGAARTAQTRAELARHEAVDDRVDGALHVRQQVDGDLGTRKHTRTGRCFDPLIRDDYKYRNFLPFLLSFLRLTLPGSGLHSSRPLHSSQENLRCFPFRFLLRYAYGSLTETAKAELLCRIPR